MSCLALQPSVQSQGGSPPVGVGDLAKLMRVVMEVLDIKEMTLARS